MTEIIEFQGRVRIEREDLPGTPRPFMVVVWDDDENERDERLEQSFETFVEAQKYGRTLLGDRTVQFTPVPTSKPVGQWVEGRVRGAA